MFIQFFNSFGYFIPSSTYFMNLMLSLNRLTIFFKLFILTDYGDGEARWEKCINTVGTFLKNIIKNSNIFVDYAFYTDPFSGDYVQI